MFKSLVQVFSAGVLVVAMSSCQNSASDVRQAARESLNPGSVQPADPTVAQPAAAVTAPTGPTTSIAFEEVRFNFGTVNAGEKVTHLFKFKNTGKEPLVITDAKSTCGCTVPDWPREPIGPGKSGEIKVVFDSGGKSGPQSKRVTIVGNTNPPETFVYVEGEVMGNSANPTTAPVNQ